jgi:hypothetical protein
MTHPLPYSKFDTLDITAHLDHLQPLPQHIKLPLLLVADYFPILEGYFNLRKDTYRFKLAFTDSPSKNSIAQRWVIGMRV